MTDPEQEREAVRHGSLEHSDMAESRRQLWWTIGVTAIGLAVITYLYLEAQTATGQPSKDTPR